MNSIKIFKSMLSFFMAFIMLIGITPLNILADISLQYIHIDGERIPINDERIQNIVSVAPSESRSSQPSVSNVVGLSANFSRDPSITMNGTRVSAMRYVAIVDGIEYEAFCADPKLRGPESSGAVYALSGEANPRLKNALQNGYPTNSEWSSFDLSEEDRMWWVYITRVAVAMANNDSRDFAGNATAIDQAKRLADGLVAADTSAYPPIMINGEKNDQDRGRIINDHTAQSNVFNITYNRKANHLYNAFKFEWASGTPDGAKLMVNGSVIATAPENSDKIFRGDISSFRIEMPNEEQFENKDAKVNLVGIHNQFANRIWLMQNPSDPDGWQDIVFYIPEISASATFSFESKTGDTIPEPTPTPTPEPQITGVKIQKIDALTRENIPGALIRLRGMSSHQVVTGDGQIWEFDNTGINLSQVLTAGATTAAGDVTSTITDGVWSIEGLPYGFYMAEEERAPQNYSLLPQHTAYGFWLLPPNVIIQAEANQFYDEYGNLIEVFDDEGNPMDVPIEYEIIEDYGVNSILLTFENFPFGEIEVTKYDEVTGEVLEGTHFRIQGYFPEGNTNGMPIDRIQITGGDGRTVFEDLPAGQYTITEVEAPPGYEFDSTEYRSISLTWGQTASTTFYNKPKTFVEVIKVDGNDTDILLDGARFRLSEPTSGEIWEGTTVGGKVRLGEGDGSYGNQLHEGKLYILTEIQAPNGYVLNPEPIEVIVAADNQLNTITVRNYRNPSLTIVKRDRDNGQSRLEGAVFEVVYENGTTVNGSPFTTDSNGEIVIDEILFEGNDERTLIITETIAPDGYNLSDPNWKNVTVRKGEDNVIVFENTRKPTLEIIKVDAITGQNLEGAEFTIEKLEEPGKGMITGNPFKTDSTGSISLPYQYSGKYRIVEVSAPNNYWLDPQQQNREWIIEVKDNEDYTLRVENTLLPTLIVTKWVRP